MGFWIVLIGLVIGAPMSFGASEDVLDLREELNRFFKLEPREGHWRFQSVDQKCELTIDYWDYLGVILFTLKNEKVELNTSFRTVTQREETVPLFNEKTYFSYYSDFSRSTDHVFLVEGVYEYLGVPGEQSTRKVLYLTRAIQLYAQGPHRYVTYSASNRDGTDSLSCVFGEDG